MKYETEREWNQMHIIKELEQRVEELEDQLGNYRIQTATGKDLDILASIPTRELGMTDAELREKIKNRFLDK
jgi:hypothetical protein